MEMMIWLGILALFGLLLWLAAPHHQRMINRRDIPKGEHTWD